MIRLIRCILRKVYRCAKMMKKDAHDAKRLPIRPTKKSKKTQVESVQLEKTLDLNL